MTKKEMLVALAAGKKVTHHYFTTKEWMKLQRGKLLFEDGVITTLEEFWSNRNSAQYENGWSIFEEEIEQKPLTEENLEMLKYFWEEKQDIERYSEFNNITEELIKKRPSLMAAWNDYKLAIERMNRELSDLTI